MREGIADMPPTSQLYDCQRFATAVTSAGGELPNSLGHLLRGYEVLTAPASQEDPGNAILDAAAAGDLDEKLLAKLLPAASAAEAANQFRQALASRAERMRSRWYRLLKDGAADEVLTSLRPAFNRHAAAIAKAKSAGINSESTLEHIVASAGSSDLVESWNALGAHVRAITQIAAVAAEFGSRPGAMLPQIREFTPGPCTPARRPGSDGLRRRVARRQCAVRQVRYRAPVQSVFPHQPQAAHDRRGPGPPRCVGGG